MGSFLFFRRKIILYTDTLLRYFIKGGNIMRYYPNEKAMSEETKKAYHFLRDYADYRNLDIFDLFEKRVLLENVSQTDWDWSMMDEIENGATEEEAEEATVQWLSNMSKYELFCERISENTQFSLMEELAERLQELVDA